MEGSSGEPEVSLRIWGVSDKEREACWNGPDRRVRAEGFSVARRHGSRGPFGPFC